MKALVNKIKYYIRLYFHFVGFNFQSQLAYRGEFFLSLFSVLMELSVRIAFLSIIYSYIPTLAGWTYPQMLFLFATSFILEAISWFTWRGSIFKLHLAIQDGSYDFLMTKPANLLFLTSFRRMDLEDGARIILGVVMIMTAIHLEHLIPTAGEWLMWGVALIFSQIVFFSFALLLKTTSFLTTQTSEINYFMYSIDRLNQYPTKIYTGWVRSFFTFFIPVTFISTVPAELINGKADGWTLLGLIGFSVGIFTLARWVFYKAIQSYSSASS